MVEGTLFIIALIAFIGAVVLIGYRVFKNAPVITDKGTYKASDVIEIKKLREGVLEVLKTTRPGTDVEITIEAGGSVKEKMTFKLEATEPG